MWNGYVLQWLDTLVTITLNPAKSPITSATTADVAEIQNQLMIEKDKIEAVIKSTVFNLDDDAKIRSSVKKYHSSLIALLDQAIENQAQLSAPASLKQLTGSIVSGIDEMLFLIESRFISYLDIEERVPATYLALVKKELIKKLSSVSKKLQPYRPYQPAFDIMKKELELFLNSSAKQSCTFRQLFYIKELCRELERLVPVEPKDIYTALDDLLISMNFNCKAYIYNITQRVAIHINHSDQPAEKMEQLLFDLKSFKQLYHRPDIIYEPKEAALYKQVDNWFAQEMFYLEKKIHYLVHPLPAKPLAKTKGEQIKQKIKSVLSVDQLALVLRAADDTKIIIARSLNSVFKIITPYLSTPHQEDLSYNSMRGKSYSAETRDKEIAIDALKRIINRINEL